MMKKNKPVNMATGGLMNMPPFIKKSEEEKEQGITAYDVNTPKEARQGLPARLLAPSRTRFNKGDVASKDFDLDGSGDTTFKDVLIGRGVIDADGNKISKRQTAYGGGLMKRQKYNVGDQVAKLKEIKLPIDDDVLDEDAFEEAPAEGDIPGEANAVKDILIKRQIEKLEAMEAITDDESQKQKINNQIEQLKNKLTPVKAAIGGMIGIEKGKYDQRPDYQAYAEGDMVEEMPMNMEESMLEKPVGMDEDMDNEDITDEDLEGMDAIIDTSALSDEEETVLDEAVEMHPELEAIIPKLVATEFTDDGEVEGPGTGTSDSIPALLSDGEFVFTAKAVKHLGVDKLRKMMKDAEESYDAGVQMQEEQQETV